MTHSQRIRLVSAGVVASYIHDISPRTTRARDTRRQRSRADGEAARPAQMRHASRRREARARHLVHAASSSSA